MYEPDAITSRVVEQFLYNQLLSSHAALDIALDELTNNPELARQAGQALVRASTLYKDWFAIAPTPKNFSSHRGAGIYEWLKSHNKPFYRTRKLPHLIGDEAQQLHVLSSLEAYLPTKFQHWEISTRSRPNRFIISLGPIEVDSPMYILAKKTAPVSYMLKNLNRDIIASFIILRNARLAGISIRSGKTAKLHCSLTLVSQLKLNL